jgi:hypothetical protein
MDMNRAEVGLGNAPKHQGSRILISQRARVHPDRKGEGGQKRAALNAAAQNFGLVTEGSVVLRITMRDERWRRRSSLAKLVT